MPVRHILLALSVVALWGFNFVVIQVGLEQVPPLLLCALRFLLAAVPAVFFIRRPAGAWRGVLAFGLVMFALQFALLFSAIRVGTTAGLAALILQAHVFFTALLAVLFLGERPSAWQLVGALVAFSGIGLVGAHLGGDVPLSGLALVLGAALSWSVGNLIAKRMGRVDMLALVVWGSLVAWPPLLLASWVLEHDRWRPELLAQLSGRTLGAIAYNVYPVTLLGYAAWSRLLRHHPATTVAPYTLLIPVVGFASSASLLGEPLPAWKIVASLLIVGGLCVEPLLARLAPRLRLAGLR